MGHLAPDARVSRLLKLYNVAATQLIGLRQRDAGAAVVLYPARRDTPVTSAAVAPSMVIFLPAFNEAANIERTVQGALRALGRVASRYQVVIVDDGSTDGTGQIAADLAARHPRKVVAVGHGRNRGYGAALQTGFQAGLRTGYDWVGFVDADGQFDTDELAMFLEAADREDAQFVAGYRVARADRWSRRRLGEAWDGLSGRIVHHGLRDVDCGFKIVHRDVLQAIHLSGTHASISPELAAKARRAGTRVAQVGVTHYPRAGGSPTGASLKVIVRSLRGLLALRREISAGTE